MVSGTFLQTCAWIPGILGVCFRTILRHAFLAPKLLRELVSILKSGLWPLPRPPETVWACDASSTGIAVVSQSQLIYKGLAVAVHIFENELLALLIAAFYAPPRTLILCDNQAVIGATTHASSRPSTICAVVTILLARKNLTVQYMPSAWNPADYPSR